MKSVLDNKECLSRSVLLVLTVLLCCAPNCHGQAATPILDWQVLLADPDPLELTDLASQYEQAISYRRGLH